MTSKAEVASEYRERLVEDLGVWADDPRSMASVQARAERVTETMAHMDRPLPHELQATEMRPGNVYKL